MIRISNARLWSLSENENLVTRVYKVALLSFKARGKE